MAAAMIGTSSGFSTPKFSKREGLYLCSDGEKEEEVDTMGGIGRGEDRKLRGRVQVDCIEYSP